MSGASKTHAAWLVKDFHVLYLAAEAGLAQAVLDGYKSAHLNDLARQLCRLRPAFEACESERKSGTPERLNEAERRALNALHRWLHSPVGEDLLIEEAQDFHELVHTEDAHDCERLEEEERIAWANASRGEVAGEEREP